MVVALLWLPIQVVHFVKICIFCNDNKVIVDGILADGFIIRMFQANQCHLC